MATGAAAKIASNRTAAKHPYPANMTLTVPYLCRDALSDSGVAHRSAGRPRELLGAENPERAVVDADAAQARTEQTS